jgi:hypothetical protein
MKQIQNAFRNLRDRDDFVKMLRATAHAILSRKTDEISRSLLLMNNGISFDKILPKQDGYFVRRIN